MAFAFLSEAGFEDGTRDHFDAESDGGARLDFPHFSDLARMPGLPAPYRGAFCMRVDLAPSVTDAYVQETGSWDTAASGTIFFRFAFWFGGVPVMASGDIFAIFQLWSGVADVEATVGIEYTDANGYRLFINETASAASAQFLPLSLNTWHMVELKAVIDSGVGNDGTLDLWLDGAAAAQRTGLDQVAITSGVVGVLGQDAGTTKGILLFDEIFADDARLFPVVDRYPDEMLVTKSGHVFVGPGCIDNVSLVAGAATDNVLSLFDTDVGNVNDASNIAVELKNTANNEIVDPAGMPVEVKRGCYVSMTGTNPRGLVKIGRAHAYSSDGAVRGYGSRRTPLPGNV